MTISNARNMSYGWCVFSTRGKPPLSTAALRLWGNTRDTSKKDLHYIHVLKPITPNGEFTELNVEMKDHQQSSSSNWILLSQPPDPSFLVTGRKSWNSFSQHNTLEPMLNCWKCFGFPNTYFPAFISSGFPVCFRTFGRELLSSWPPLSDDDTQGSVKTNANHWESLEWHML